jgi:RNA polymerase sigma-70 factor (ECF subfamily)
MLTTHASLLERLRGPGQPEAWSRFVRLYTPLLYSWARAAGAADADAADLVQDVFVVLLEELPGFAYDRHRSFRAWLRAVTLNRWRDRCRRPRPAGGEALEGVGTADPLEALWEREYRRHLAARALEVMRAEFRHTTWRACWESVVEGRPAAEVAARLGLSENAVWIARSRVLRRLRQELAGLLE